MKYRVKWIKDTIGSPINRDGTLYTSLACYYGSVWLDINDAYKSKNEAEKYCSKAELIVEEYE